MRRTVIAGNWKMNMTPSESASFAKDLAKENFDENVDVIVCPPLTSLAGVNEAIKDSGISLGAQNMYFEESGAYTGEVSPAMLKDAGVEYVIIGHSERREIFGEDDQVVGKKVRACLDHGMKPILCCGETLEEREENKQEEKVLSQIKNALENVSEEEAKNIIIAYEPIWAIGTGKTASAEDASQMVNFIRKSLEEIYSKDFADQAIIQYGGSVKAENAEELLGSGEIDGALVGGASLDVESFKGIINFKK